MVEVARVEAWVEARAEAMEEVVTEAAMEAVMEVELVGVVKVGEATAAAKVAAVVVPSPVGMVEWKGVEAPTEATVAGTEGVSQAARKAEGSVETPAGSEGVR